MTSSKDGFKDVANASSKISKKKKLVSNARKRNQIKAKHKRLEWLDLVEHARRGAMPRDRSARRAN